MCAQYTKSALLKLHNETHLSLEKHIEVLWVMLVRLTCASFSPCYHYLFTSLWVFYRMPA